MFGLEIRKLNKENLFADVDRVLSKDYNIEKETLVHGLQNMLKPSGCFSICTITECATVCNIIIPDKELAIYRVIHCIDWSAMEEEYRTYIVAMILNNFKSVLA